MDRSERSPDRRNTPRLMQTPCLFVVTYSNAVTIRNDECLQPLSLSLDQVAESRIRDWLIGVQSPPALYARHMVDGRSHTVKGGGFSGSALGHRVPRVVWGGTSPSTLTDTRPPCFEVEKHALRLGASAHYLPTNWGPPQNRLPVNNVRGQTGQYTQHKRDGVPPRNETKAPWSLVTPDPLEVEDRPGRKSRRTLRHRPARVLDDRCQPGIPPNDDLWGPSGKGLPSATAEARPFLKDLLDPLWTSSITHPEGAPATVCFFVLCNRHRFNRIPGPPPRDGLGVTYLPTTLSSDAGYARLPIRLGVGLLTL